MVAADRFTVYSKCSLRLFKKETHNSCFSGQFFKFLTLLFFFSFFFFFFLLTMMHETLSGLFCQIHLLPCLAFFSVNKPTKHWLAEKHFQTIISFSTLESLEDGRLPYVACLSLYCQNFVLAKLFACFFFIL